MGRPHYGHVEWYERAVSRREKNELHRRTI
jgi:hypothetical protein